MRYNGIKVWVALVCMFFDHHMQVVTDVQLRWPQLGYNLFTVYHPVTNWCKCCYYIIVLLPWPLFLLLMLAV